MNIGYIDPKKIGNRKTIENKTCIFISSGTKESEADFKGAGIIIPKARKRSLFDLTRDEILDTFDLLAKAKKYIDQEYKPDGYTIGWTIGDVAGKRH